MIDIACLYQNDRAWKDVPLGFQEQETIGSWGGLLTCLVMVLNAAGYQETPLSLNDKLKDYDGYIDALPIPATLPLVFDNFHYCGYESFDDRPAPLDRINSALDSGQPIIVQVDWNPNSRIFSHWVIIKEQKGEDYLICDPFRYKGDLPDKEVLLTERYKIRGKDPADVITGVLWLEITLDVRAVSNTILQATSDTLQSETPHSEVASQPEPESDGIDESQQVQFDYEPITLVPTVDGVAFRNAPVIKVQTQIRRLKNDDVLTSLEPVKQVMDKIGEHGQWIHVEDENGQSGYIAAWYVQLKR